MLVSVIKTSIIIYMDTKVGYDLRKKGKKLKVCLGEPSLPLNLVIVLQLSIKGAFHFLS